MRVGASRPQKIRIAARKSDLARLQAYRVGDALKAHHPDLEIVYNFRASLGDLNQNDPLWRMPGKGVFTEDFLEDLNEGRVDLVVHSWKDLPTEMRPTTEIAATLPRADVRDLLLFRRDRMAIAASAGRVRVLSSSPRRAHNLDAFLKTYLPFPVSQVAFESVRGNVQTRVKKLFEQDADALIVAKAAIDRLLAAREPEFAETQTLLRDWLSRARFMALPLTVNPSAAAQGALAIEIAKRRTDLRELLAEIHDAETFACVEAERAILAGYGGGCHQKIGVSILRRPFGEVRFVRGLSDGGEVLDRVEIRGAGVEAARAAAPEALFPAAGETARFFAREPLPRETWARAEKAKALWVARESAWPDEFVADADAVVWAAGLGTWRKLAERGVWVNGCAESLGEDENERLETLLGVDRVDWLKLTHERAAAAETAETACATYRLKPEPVIALQPAGRTHFYWSSGSAFDRALELWPELRGRHHACGPGRTYRHLRQILGETAAIGVYLGIEDWRRAVLARA